MVRNNDIIFMSNSLLEELKQLMLGGEHAECGGDRINPATVELPSEGRMLWSFPDSWLSRAQLFK